MKIDKELRKKLVGIKASLETEDGLELCDPQSKFVEIGPRRLTLADQIKRVLRKEVERYALHAEMESPKDADDFDIDDEAPLPLSGFEHEDLVEDTIPAPEILSAPAAEEPVGDAAAGPEVDVDAESQSIT